MGASPYGPKADAGPPGLAAKLLSFCEELRSEGVAVGTSEILDAFAALDEVPWTAQEDFREALAATIAKSQEDRRVFELLFDRFFFRAAEAEAVERGIGEEGQRHEGGERLDIDELREQIRQAIVEGNDGEMRDLARLAIAAFGRRAEGSGVVGVDVQRIRRTLGLSAGAQPPAYDGAAELPPIDRDQLNRFERHLRRELERDLIERTETLPPSRPLAELDRALPTSPTQDLAAVHRAVSQMKRRLATLGHEQRGRRKGQAVDVRRTMRASLETGGVPLRLRYRPKRPRRPEIYVLCDVSTSVTSASVFFLSVLHALHDSFRKLRSFVFIERISEVTEVFEHERDFRVIAQRISSEGGVADVSGYTDYGRVWLEFLSEISDELDPRSTVIVLGDARTNGREPHAEVFAQVAERAGRLFWLNPEPKLYWNYGDSVMAAYERYCDGAFECWTTRHLENFVNVVAGGVPAQAGRSWRRGSSGRQAAVIYCPHARFREGRLRSARGCRVGGRRGGPDQGGEACRGAGHSAAVPRAHPAGAEACGDRAGAPWGQGRLLAGPARRRHHDRRDRPRRRGPDRPRPVLPARVDRVPRQRQAPARRLDRRPRKPPRRPRASNPRGPRIRRTPPSSRAARRLPGRLGRSLADRLGGHVPGARTVSLGGGLASGGRRGSGPG